MRILGCKVICMANVQDFKPQVKIQSDRAFQLAIALISGISMGLTPAPFNVWGLAWVAIAPLWILVVENSTKSTDSSSFLIRPRFKVLLAIAWGLGYHGFGLAWIMGLHPLTWLGIPWLASVTIVLIIWLFITAWGAALVGVWAWIMRWISRAGISSGLRVLVGTAVWCGLESLWALGSLNWTSVSYTQSPHNLAILHLGQISGAMTVTAAIVSVNGLLAEAWIASRNQREPRKSVYLVPVSLFLILHLIGFGLYSRPLIEAPDAVLKVGIIQGNVPTRIKLFSDGLQRAIEGYSTGYRTLVDRGAEVVLTPEGALPFLWQGVNRTQNPLYQAVLEKGVPVWLGTFIPQGSQYTQSLLTIAPTGEAVSRYNKVKLVPLGEYTPFQDLLGGLINRLSPIRANMLPGSQDQQFDTPFGRAAVGICYDSAFPDLFRAQVAKGAEFILTASNLDPYSTTLKTQHQAHDLMRAIEHDRWSIRATNTGYSGIIDPHGRIQWRSQPDIYEIHVGTIYRRSTQTLYVRWGNWLTPGLIGLAEIGLLIRKKIPFLLSER